jgi:serine/threonine-protein kinase
MAYISPEQFQGARADRKVDIYAAAVVLWETLTGERLFLGESEAQTVSRVLNDQVSPPSKLVPELPPALDTVVMRGLSRDPAERPETARDMARDLEAAFPVATPFKVAEWVDGLVGESLAERAKAISKIEQIQDLSRATVSSSPPRMLAGSEDPTAVEYRVGTLDSDVDVDAEPDSTSVPPFVASERKRRRAVLVFLGALAGFVIALVLLFAFAQSGAEDRTAKPRTERSASPLTAPKTPTNPPVAVPSADPVSSTATAPSAAPEPSAAPPKATATRTKPGGRPKDRDQCNPPYTIDEEGHRRYKMECL